MKRIHWGILGTAKIAVEKVIPAMQSGVYGEITAIASRDLEKARETAQGLNIPKSYGSYSELLADPGIDAVYIPLPNHLHVPWSIKALNADKHVLCEKPIGRGAAEALKLLQAARKNPALKVMEAFMYRHHPQWRRVKELVDEITIETCDQYTIQGDLFARAVLEDSDVPTPLEDALANMIVIEALIESAESGTWCPVRTQSR